MIKFFRALSTIMLQASIRIYQFFVSPILGPRCRYFPTCSEYAMDAIELHGPITGAWLALKRILRCHPWGGSGLDPVPPRERGKCDCRDTLAKPQSVSKV